MRRFLARSLVGVTLALSLLISAIGPASALTVVAPRHYDGNYGDIDYSCSYQASLVSTDVNTVNVALTATATVTPDQTTNPPFATAVNCWLSPGTGGAGLTTPGGTSTAAGTASFKVRDGLPNVCFSAAALYTGGQSDTAPTQCVPIDGSLLSVK